MLQEVKREEVRLSTDRGRVFLIPGAGVVALSFALGASQGRGGLEWGRIRRMTGAPIDFAFLVV